jgi:hypothetical protein
MQAANSCRIMMVPSNTGGSIVASYTSQVVASFPHRSPQPLTSKPSSNSKKALCSASRSWAPTKAGPNSTCSALRNTRPCTRGYRSTCGRRGGEVQLLVWPAGVVALCNRAGCSRWSAAGEQAMLEWVGSGVCWDGSRG